MKDWKLKVQGSRFKVQGWRLEQGFTLIEVILVLVLIGIMAALAANLIANSLDQGRFDETWKEMNSVKMAIVGNPDLNNAGVRSDFGYVGDMGTIPSSLTELLEQGAQPAWAVYDAALGTGTGWRGPYIDNKKDDGGTYLATLDGWGYVYVYNSGDIAGTGRVRSYGSDGASGGSGYAADITVPESDVATTGDVAGRVTDIIGNPVRNTNVTITYPDPASKGNPTSSIVATDDGGNYVFNSIPIGKHRVQLTVGDPPPYKKVAVVLPSQTARLDFQVSSDPTIPSAPSGLTVSRATPTQLNLSWGNVTTNTDGSSILDLAGYNIYRSTISGFAPLPSNLLANMGLVTVYSDVSLTPGTTYYYQIRAIDRANKESANSGQVSQTVSPIVQGTTTTTGNGTSTHTFYITNNSSSSIVISTMALDWNPSGANAKLTGINIGGGPSEWSAPPGPKKSNPTGDITLSSSYTLAGSATNVSVALSFDGNLTVNWLTVKFGSTDGFFYVGY